jgi:hypothetical protein
VTATVRQARLGLESHERPVTENFDIARVPPERIVEFAVATLGRTYG